MIDTTIFPRPLKALYHSFGCKLNFAETASVADAFARKGIFAVGPGDTPDIIVVNTCSVTAEADRKCRSAIRSFNRRYPQARIFVTGCYAQLRHDEAAALPGVALVAGVNDKLALVDSALAALGGSEVHMDVPEAKDLRDFMPDRKSVV